MIKNYFKTAFRNLLRNKIYSFINIARLSLGLACAMLIMLYIKVPPAWLATNKWLENGDKRS